MCTPRRSIRMANFAVKARFAVLGLALFALAAPAFADDDPPDRVARLSYIHGDVSFQPAGEDDWTQADLNRPLGTGDHLFTDNDARAELEIGTATVRLDAQSSFDVLNLGDNVAQTELTAGVMSLHIDRVFDGQSYEVDTPTLAFVITQAGDYRIDIAPDGSSTMVTVFGGAGDVYGENNASYSVQSGQSYRFHDSALQDYEVLDIPNGDDFDSWVQSRNTRAERSVSRQYVSDDVIGATDLDDYGGWSNEPEYGQVWYPTQVAADWAPYRSGHWAWIDPWGWSWVDTAAWGFAPFHYGRWVYARDRWGWCPGERGGRSIYAPALVGFVGGAGWGIGLRGGGGPVGWFPLGPRDVYVPWYRGSRSYFTNVNVRNSRGLNNTYITNVYNNYSRGGPITGVNYAYRQNANALTAVSRETFVGARAVNTGRVQVNANQLRGGDVVSRIGIAPERASFVSATAGRARAVPNAQTLNRGVIARTPPPPRAAPVATRIAAIQRNDSQPLGTQQLRQIGTRPGVNAPAGTAITNRGTAQRVQVVGQNATKPQPLPARAGVANGTRVGTPVSPTRTPTAPITGNGRTPVVTRTQPTTTPPRGVATTPSGNTPASGLPSSRFSPNGRARTTNDTTPRTMDNASTTPRSPTTGPSTTRTPTDRAAVGRTPVTTGTQSGTPSSVERRTTTRTAPTDNTQRYAQPTTPVEQRRTVTPQTNNNQQPRVESRTVVPQTRSVQPVQQREYTPRTVTPTTEPRVVAPQPQIQRAPVVQQRQLPQPQERREPARDDKARDDKKKDDDRH